MSQPTPKRTFNPLRRKTPPALLCALALFATPHLITAQTTATATGGAPGAMHSGGSDKLPRSIDLKLKLPFLPGQAYTIIQGNHGTYTHTGFNEYAWDFGLPLDTPVCAAAAGRVVRVKQDGTQGGPSDEYFGDGNAIIIDHGNGYFTQYLHLAFNSATVFEGQLVAGGQVIAKSGNTGFSSMPHLHFHVQDCTGRSLPARFQDVPGNGIPEETTTVTSKNDGTGTGQYDGESYLQPDVFQANNIQILTRNLPGHLYRIGNQYTIRGRLTNSTTRRVAIYIMSAAGGKAIYTSYATTDENGFFTADFDPSQIKKRWPTWSDNPKESNLFSLAMAPVDDQGIFWSNVSVPICIR